MLKQIYILLFIIIFSCENLDQTQEINGCVDLAACNYNSFATIDNGLCEYESCLGCTDDSACNYNSLASIDDNSCEFSEENFDCIGNCLGKSNGSLAYDSCAVCDGNGGCLCDDGTTSCLCCCPAGEQMDCLGECNGSAIIDECNICNGSGLIENFDCDGNCIIEIDCNDICGGDAIEDECGICEGDGTSCINLDQLDIISWNLENFPKSYATVDSLSYIINDLYVDIVALQEITQTSALEELANNELMCGKSKVKILKPSWINF